MRDCTLPAFLFLSYHEYHEPGWFLIFHTAGSRHVKVTNIQCYFNAIKEVSQTLNMGSGRITPAGFIPVEIMPEKKSSGGL